MPSQRERVAGRPTQGLQPPSPCPCSPCCSLGPCFRGRALNDPHLDKALKPLEALRIPGIQRNPESQSGGRDPEVHDPRPGRAARRLDALGDGREGSCDRGVNGDGLEGGLDDAEASKPMLSRLVVLRDQDTESGAPPGWRPRSRSPGAGRLPDGSLPPARSGPRYRGGPGSALPWIFEVFQSAAHGPEVLKERRI
jgi:hypothetical protein